MSVRQEEDHVTVTLSVLTQWGVSSVSVFQDISCHLMAVDVKVNHSSIFFNSLPASCDVCTLLIIFVNSLDPDLARQNVSPDVCHSDGNPERVHF